MCRKTIYRTYGAGRLRRMAAIDMLLLWSKVRVLVVVLDEMRSTRMSRGHIGVAKMLRISACLISNSRYCIKGYVCKIKLKNAEIQEYVSAPA